jgi:outer membrane protein assembly factor BamB
VRPSAGTRMHLIALLVIILGLLPAAVSAVVFTDDFTSGFGNWDLYGSPLPVLLPSFGGRTGVFDNNGDSTCDSGIATKSTFSFTSGGVIRSDVYLAVSDWGGCWGSSEISITRDRDPYQDNPSCPGEGYYDGATISLAGIGDACWATPAQYRRHAYVQCSILAEDGTSEGNGYSFPADGYTNGWHTLQMVVDPDRYVSCYIDATLVYRTQKKVNQTVLQDKRIQLGRRSSGSIGKAYHDNVIVEVNQALAAAATTPVPPANQPMMFRANPQHTGDYRSFSGGIIPNGQLKWSFTTGGQVTSSPSVADGVVYVGSGDGRVYAIDAATGTQRWAFTTGAYVAPSPAVAGGTVYAGSKDGNLYALDAGTGALKWIFPAGMAIEGSPTVADGVVYFGTWDSSAGMRDNIYAIDVQTGTQRWVFPIRFVVPSSPAVADGTVYVGSLDFKVYALDAATGTQKWTFPTRAVVAASPAVSNGVVFVGSQDNKVYALDARTGTQKWSFTTGEMVRSSPAVADGVVFIGSDDHHVYALDAGTGARKWAFTTGNFVISSPAVADGVVYVGSSDDHLYALDAGTGAMKWAFQTGDLVLSSPAVADGVVYVGSNDGKLYAIGNEPGPVSQVPTTATPASVTKSPTSSSRVPLASDVIPPGYLPASAVASGIGLAAAGAALQGVSGSAGGATTGGTASSAGGTTPGGARPDGWLSRQMGRLKDLLIRFFRARSLATVSAKETEHRKLEPVLRPPVFLGFSARELATIGVSVPLYAGAFAIAGRLQTDLQSVALFLAMGTFAVICHELVTIRLARYHAVRSEFRFWGLGTGILIGNAAIFGLAFGTPSRTLLKGLEALRPYEEITIMAAGPLVNLLFAVVSFLMMPFGGIIGLAGAVGFPVNILNAVYSMIPVKPLKGKVIYGSNRLIWAAIFFPIIALYSIAYLIP